MHRVDRQLPLGLPSLPSLPSLPPNPLTPLLRLLAGFYYLWQPGLAGE